LFGLVVLLELPQENLSGNIQDDKICYAVLNDLFLGFVAPARWALFGLIADFLTSTESPE
jgi:hypothetical protein